MAPVNLPPGFRFRPTDVEIVRYYLKTKVHGIKLELQVIGEIDLYKCEPWDLPEKSLLHSRDPEWYFFCPRDRKYPNGLRTNRATEAGYWKATGKDRKVSFQSSTIGMKKTLVFYKGRAPHGERTDWIMHEYRLQEKEREGATGLQDTYVLCRVFKKSGLGPKDGGQYDSPIEESCFSISKNKSPTRITSPGEIEDQSEETCLPVMQEEDTRASSGLPSETSSEILSSMTNNNNCLNGSMEPLQDAASPPNCDFTSQQEPGSNKNAESMPSPRLQCRNICPPWDIKDFPEIPDDLNFTETGYLFGEKMDASVEEAEILHIAHESQDPSYFIDNFGDILDGKILELDDFLPSIEELENLEPCLVEVADKLPDREGCQIQIRSRTPTWQSHQQTLASQGTAARRVRLQMHKTADANGQYGCTGHPQAATHDWHDHNSGELQVISHLKDSSLAALPRQMSALLEACPPKASRALDCGCTRDVGSIVLAESNNPKFGPISISNAESMDVNSWNNSLDYCMPDGAKRSPTTEFQCIGENEDSDFFPDSVEISERGGIGDGSTSMPQHSTSEYLLKGEPLEIIEMSGNGKSPSKYESTILKKWQSLISSGCGQPSCVLAASLTAVILQDGGEIPKQLFHKSADNCISDSLTNECTLLGESELTQKCEITPSKKDSIENQAVESDEKLVYGETLVFAETSTMKQSLENTAAPTNLPEMVLAKEDFECSGATSSFLSSIPIHSGLAMEHPTAWILKKGVLDSEVGTSPGLIQDLSISAYSTTLPETCMHCKGSVERSDFNRTSSGLTRRVKYNGLGGEGKSMDVAEDISECCSKQCINGSVSLEKASDIFMGLFQLQRRSSKGSNVSSMLVYLLGTAFLMLCFFLLRIIWHFAGTASPLIS